MIGKSQENTDIMRRHEACARCWLLRKGNTEEKTNTETTSNYSNWSPSYRSV